MTRNTYWIKPEDLSDMKTDYLIKTVDDFNEMVDLIKSDNGWFEKFREIAYHYGDRNPDWGALHIVLSDGNLADTHVSWCAGFACGTNDHEALDLADLLSQMTAEQRKRVYDDLQIKMCQL